LALFKGLEFGEMSLGCKTVMLEFISKNTAANHMDIFVEDLSRRFVIELGIQEPGDDSDRE
jgi:hypothetical protein